MDLACFKKENWQELPSRDPDFGVKLRVCLLQEQGELGRNFLEDPDVEDIIETSRETQR